MSIVEDEMKKYQAARRKAAPDAQEQMSKCRAEYEKVLQETFCKTCPGKCDGLYTKKAMGQVDVLKYIEDECPGYSFFAGTYLKNLTPYCIICARSVFAPNGRLALESKARDIQFKIRGSRRNRAQQFQLFQEWKKIMDQIDALDLKLREGAS